MDIIHSLMKELYSSFFISQFSTAFTCFANSPPLPFIYQDCYAIHMEVRRIPNSLKKYRRLAGLSQKEVAAFLGLQKSSCISRWEKGACLPGTAYLFRLSMLYKTVPNHLYYDFWQTLKKESLAKEVELLTHHESLMSNEIFYL